jgi:hypothetical protein
MEQKTTIGRDTNRIVVALPAQVNPPSASFEVALPREALLPVVHSLTVDRHDLGMVEPGGRVGRLKNHDDCSKIFIRTARTIHTFDATGKKMLRERNQCENSRNSSPVNADLSSLEEPLRLPGVGRLVTS